MHGTAFAWSNNLLGRLSYVASPIAVGVIAGRVGFGPTLAATAIFPLICLVLVLLWLPETAGRELVGTITDAQLTEIAQIKLPDLNANDMDAAKLSVAGTARSMGIKVS